MQIIRCLIIALCCSTLLSATPENRTVVEHNPIVKIETNVGDIIIVLHTDTAPITCKNFLKYVNDKYYNGTIFHRAIDGFLIQGGGFLENFSQKETYPPIRNESMNTKSNTRGTIGMALTTDSHSATTQFYINVVHNKDLDYKRNKYGYAVFGHVLHGIEVVDRIKKMKTKSVSYYSKRYKRFLKHRYVPIQPIIILNTKVLRAYNKKEYSE